MKDTFTNKTVLVTGANGFVGAHLVNVLEKQGAQVFAQVRQNSDTYRFDRLNTKPTLIEMDLCELTTVRQHLEAIRPHYVFNTAVNRNYDDLTATIQLNTLALVNLLESAQGPRLQAFVHCGSSTEYGNLPGPLNETDLPEPCTLYGGAKLAGSHLLQSLSKSRKIPTAILRLFHVYGPLESDNRLIPTAIHNLINDKPVKLTDPGCTHDPVHIDDVVNACLLAARAGSYGDIFNIANGCKISNEDIVNTIASILGKTPSIHPGAFEKREWDRDDWFANVDKARNVLGWKASMDLQAGLSKTIDWMKNHAA